MQDTEAIALGNNGEDCERRDYILGRASGYPEQHTRRRRRLIATICIALLPFTLFSLSIGLSFLLTKSLNAAGEAALHHEKTPSATFIVQEFSSAKVAGEEIIVLSGQAVVMYADHLPQAGGSGDEAVSRTELKNQLKILAVSPSFEKIPAVWGLSNNCTYTIYVDIYYIGILRITVVDAKLTHQIVSKWRTNNHVAHHYTSENEIPCLAA